MSARQDASGDAYYERTLTGFSTSVFSWCGWVYISVDRNDYCGFLQLDSSSFLLGFNNNGTSLILTNSSLSNVISGPNMTVGQWYFVGVTKNGTGAGTTTLYWAQIGDATLTSATGNFPNINANAPMDLLSWGVDDAARWFNGRLYSVRAWDGVALSGAEMLAEYESPDVPVRTSGLYGHWLKTASTADLSGNGNSLTGGTGITTETDAGIPDTVAGIIGWWESTDPDTITDAGSGAVSAWRSKTTTGYVATASGSTRPITGSRTINGHNAIDFDGGDDRLSASVTSVNQPLTVFVVGEPDAQGELGRWFQTISGVIIYQHTGDDYWMYAGSARPFDNPSDTVEIGVPVVLTAKFNTTSSRIYLNGVAATTTGTAGTNATGTSWGIGSYPTGGENGNIALAAVLVYTGALSDANREAIENFLIAKYLTAGGQAVEIGQVTETDAALALTRAKQKAIVQVTEVDASLAIAAKHARAVGQVLEVDSAQEMTYDSSQVVQITQATEVDTAGDVTSRKQLQVSQVLEANTAQALTRHKQQAVQQVLEVDTAQPVILNPIHRLVQQVIEVDSAQALGHAKVREVLQALEVDTAQAFSTHKRMLLGQPFEVDTAFSFSGAAAYPVQQVEEVDTAQVFTAHKLRVLSQVLEVDEAQSFTHLKRRLTGQVLEADIALALTATKLHVVGQVVEINAALALASLKRRAVQQVLEADQALSVASAKVRAIQQASELSTALAFHGVHTRSITAVLEVDLAQPVTRRPNSIGFVIELDTAIGFTFIGGVVQVFDVLGIITSWRAATVQPRPIGPGVITVWRAREV